MRSALFICLLALLASCSGSGGAVATPTATAAPTLSQVLTNPIAADAYYGDKERAKQQALFVKRRLAARSRTPSLALSKAAQVASLNAYQQHAAKTTTPGLFGVAPSVYPAAWQVTDWYVDEQNVSGTASDNNNCQSPATACSTFGEIVYHRFGTTQPVLLGGTLDCVVSSITIHLLSPWSDSAADAIELDPFCATADFVGPLSAVTQIASGTLASVIPKNAVADQVLTATLAPAVVRHTLIHNTTHDSYAWTAFTTGSNVWLLSQPVTEFAVAEVNTWANGDSYVAYTPINMMVNYLGPLTTTQFVSIGVGTSHPGASLLSAAAYSETRLEPILGQPASTLGFGLNADFVETTVFSIGSLSLAAGMYAGQNNIQGELHLSKDWLSVGLNVIPRIKSTVETAWIQSVGGPTGNMLVPDTLTLTEYIAGNSPIFVTGIGNINYAIAAGAGRTAAQVFLNTTASPPLVFGGTRVSNILAYSIFTAGTTATMCGGIALTAANLDIAASATCATTGFGGNAFIPGQGSITNN